MSPPRVTAFQPHLAMVALLLAGGCADPNAILEVSISLPPRPTDAPEKHFAFAQFRGDAVAFEDAWPADVRDYPGAELTDSRQTVDYSVISEDDTIRLHVKIRFCSGSDPKVASCTDAIEADERSPDSGALWFEIEQPFYIGERTEWSPVIPDVPTVRPTSETAVGKCEIKGCVDAFGAVDFCRGDGTHFCE